MAVRAKTPEAELRRSVIGVRVRPRSAVEDARVYWLFVAPALLVVVALIAAPLVYAFWLSLRNFNLTLNTNAFVGASNYVRVFTADSGFVTSLARTLGYVLAVIAFDFTFGFAEAYLLYRMSASAAQFFRGFFMLPILLIPSASAMLWRLVMYGSPNIEFLRALGLEGILPPPLSDPGWAFVGILVTVWWAWSPWVFVLLLGGLEALDSTVLEAAQVEGASEWRIVWGIILPLMRPVIFVALTFKAVDSFLSFTFIWVMTQGGPGNATHLLSTYIYQTAFRFLNIGYGSALAMVMLLVSAALSTVGVVIWQRHEEPA